MNALARLCAATLGFSLCLVGFGAEGFDPIGPASGVLPAERGLRISCSDGSSVQLSFLAPDLVRLRTVFVGQKDEWEHSWAVERAEAAWPAVSTDWSDAGEEVRIRSDVLEIRIHKNPLLVSFVDRKAGVVFHADARPVERDRRSGAVAAYSRLGFDEHFYGLGERAARLDRRRGEFTLWNSDTPGYVEGTDPLYQSIPFYLGLENGRAYGVFHDNSFRSTFDFGRLNQEYVRYRSEGGVIDCYVFAGPDVRGILRRYGELTGRMPLPPRWAIGHHQSRYSYYPDSLVEQVVDTYRGHDLPLDAVYLDIHYMDEFRSFTWNGNRFSNPKALLERLQKRGVRVVTIVDPGIKYVAAKPGKSGYAPLDSGSTGNHFLRRTDGSLYVGEVWPGPAVFADFSREDTRQWWGDLHQEFLEQGVAGFWNDMNEPSDFRDKSGESQGDVVFEGQGRKSSYLENRNLYGLLMSRATFEGLSRLHPDARPFVITRAGYAGIQRYAATWTGDNNATWEGLSLSLSMFQSMGLSGQAFVGCDIPGFIGRAGGELLARSYEALCFTPLFRNHGAIDGYDHEPWRFGPQYEAIVRDYIKLRYQLLPYLYTCLEEAHREGLPVIRPLLVDFQTDPGVANLDDQFMVGDALMLAPVLRPGERGREVYLPEGSWYDFWTGAKVDAGFRRFDAPLERLPLFVRGGRALVSTVAMNFVSEKPWNPVRFDLYPDSSGKCEGALYEDDGDTQAHQRGVFRRTCIHLETTKDGWRLKLDAPQGTFRPSPRNFELAVHTVGAGVRGVAEDGAALAISPAAGTEPLGWNVEGGILRVRLADDGDAHTFKIQKEPRPVPSKP